LGFKQEIGRQTERQWQRHRTYLWLYTKYARVLNTDLRHNTVYSLQIRRRLLCDKARAEL